MHEFALATQIVENVTDYARSHQVGKVLQVRLLVGELTCVEAEQLRFCYNSITRETVLENSVLDIEAVPAVVRCSLCRYEGPPKYWGGALSATAIPTLQCPQCGQAAEATGGHECEIESVQLVQARTAGVAP